MKLDNLKNKKIAIGGLTFLATGIAGIIGAKKIKSKTVYDNQNLSEKSKNDIYIIANGIEKSVKELDSIKEKVELSDLCNIITTYKNIADEKKVKFKYTIAENENSFDLVYTLEEDIFNISITK